MQTLKKEISFEQNAYANDKRIIEDNIHSINDPRQLEAIKNMISLFNRKYGRSAHTDALQLRGYAAGWVCCMIEHNVKN